MNILNRIEDLLIAFLDLADFIRLYGERQTRRLLRFELQLSAAMIGLFIFGMIMGWQVLVVFSAFFTSILGLAIWKQTEIVLNGLSALSGIKLQVDNATLNKILKPITKPIELSQKVMDPVAEGMKRILMPLLTVTLGISFLASYIAIKGLDYFNLKDLMIYSMVILFLTIFFWAYIGTKRKIAGKLMFVWLLWLITSNYVWPIQCQELLETAENKTIGWAIGKASESRNEKIINITTNTPLYQYDHGNIKFLRTAGKDIKAKIIGRKKSPNTDETLYRVILPVQDGVYIAGEDVYVPARLTSTVARPSPLVQKTGQTSTLSPGFETMPVGVHSFTVNKTMTSWMKIPGNANWDLAAAKDGNWKLIPFKGEVVTYKADGEKYGDFPNQTMIFKIQTDEEMSFVLKVTPKV